MIVLSKSERRALLLVSLVLAISAVIQWISPHQFSTRQFDYTLQDSLFKVLSTDTLPETPEISTEQPKSPASNSKKKKKKKKGHDLKPHSIDVNRADSKTLEKLPRIGPKTARAIIDYRTEHGPFKSIEELDNVKGIGPKTIEKLRPFIFISLTDSTGRSSPGTR